MYRCTVVYAGLFFFQAEDGIRDLVRSRGLGDVYKRQQLSRQHQHKRIPNFKRRENSTGKIFRNVYARFYLSLIHI